MIYQFYLWDSESFKKAVFFFKKFFWLLLKVKGQEDFIKLGSTL